MPIGFFIDGKTLPLVKGLPGNYSGHVLRGSNALHYHDEDILIVVQSAETSLCCFRILHIRFERPVKLLCKYAHAEKVLLARTVSGHPATEWIKAGGRQVFHKKQFSCLFGLSWQSLLAPADSCDYVFFDVTWKEEMLTYRLKRDLIAEMDNVRAGVPNRIDAGRLTTSAHMDKMLHIFRHYDYNDPFYDFLDMNMDRYLTLLLNRIYNFNYSMLNVKEDHWKAVGRVCHYIGNNLDKDLTIPELSKIALTSPTNLKRYFLLVTGFTVDDFRTYLRLKSTLFHLALTDRQVKDVYSMAYYTSASAFCAGFRKVFFCSPTEVRSDNWDTGFL